VLVPYSKYVNKIPSHTTIKKITNKYLTSREKHTLKQAERRKKSKIAMDRITKIHTHSHTGKGLSPQSGLRVPFADHVHTENENRKVIVSKCIRFLLHSGHPTICTCCLQILLKIEYPARGGNREKYAYLSERTLLLWFQLEQVNSINEMNKHDHIITTKA